VSHLLLLFIYSGRYASFAKDLNKQGYGVFGMDWIGNKNFQIAMPFFHLWYSLLQFLPSANLIADRPVPQ
jgi:hypothetical protein